MKNYEVAKCFAENALSYIDDKVTVVVNLDYIIELLDKAEEENEEYTWDDFK